MFMSLYIKDATELAKISNVTIYYGSSSGITNSYEFSIDSSDLSTGWNRIVLDWSDSDTTTNGTPDNININHLKIKVTTNNTTDTFSAGELMMDFWFLAQYESYEGDIIQWDKDETLPDSSSNFEIEYVPLSLEVPVTAVAIGDEYNVTKGKVIYQVNVSPYIDRIYNYEIFSGGVDVESDEDYKDRIQNATQLKTNATVAAITYNILDLDFVKSVSVIDTPTETKSDEAIVFVSGVSKYTLSQEVAQDNTNLEIRTDYILTPYTNEIEWLGVNDPSAGATFYVSYDYEDLGRFECYVVGQNGSLTTAQLSQVEDVVDETRSAGVVGVVTEPTYISQNVEINLDTETTYTRSEVEEDVESAITLYVNNLEVGDDVLVSGIVNAVMNVEGVENVTVVTPASDTTIDDDEKAEIGTITINAWP